MSFVPDVLAIGLILPPFFIGARQDFSRRMVKDWVWLACIPAALAGSFESYLTLRLLMVVFGFGSMASARYFGKGGSADLAAFPLFVWVLGPLELLPAIATLPLWAKWTDWKRTPLVTCLFLSLCAGFTVAVFFMVV